MRESVIPEATEKLQALGVENQFKVLRTGMLNMTTGSEIIFKGLKASSGNQTANLKSLHNISTWVLDEAEELVEESDFDTIDLSIRAPDVQNRIILIMNPTTKEHWAWDRWFEGHTKYIDVDGFQIPVSNHPDVCHIHTTYLNNLANIPEDYLKIFERMKIENPKKYKHKVLGAWLEKAEGVIFEEWTECEFDESLPSIWGMDFGVVDPTTLVKVAVDKKRKRIYIKEYLYESSMRPTSIVEKVGQHVGKMELIVADSAEGLTINELIYNDFNVQKALKGPDSVKHGIRQMMDYEICIDPDSHNAKKEFNNYIWNDKKSETPVDDYNHIIDPVRYALQILIKQSQQFVI